MRSRFLAIELLKRHRLLLSLLATNTFLGCSYTIVESYYESRLPVESEFVEPGDYLCPDQGSDGREVYDSGQSVRVFLSDNSAWNYDGGMLEFSFTRFRSRGIDARLLSDDFYILTSDARFKATVRSYESWTSVNFQVQIPDRFERFTLQVPDMEINGVVHTIPPIEFRKVTGDRTVSTLFCL